MRLLKWAGSKHWLVERYAHLLPERPRRYREPFLGGGAIADHYIGRVPCTLSDTNAKLIAMYRGVQDDADGVIEMLSGLKYDRGTYDAVRAAFNLEHDQPEMRVAAMFIYLNRTCFNGLYRENRKGEFNVPFGKYTNPTICDAQRLREVSKRLEDVVLAALDFESALSLAEKDDFVFLDPPYVPLTKTANFTGYSAGGFGPDDQRRLAKILRSLPCHWLLTNADTPETRELYAGWHMESVPVRRSINSKGDKRGAVNELLVSNHPLDMRAAA